MRMKTLLLSLLAVAYLPSTSPAQAAATVPKPRIEGFAPERLARIDQTLQRLVDENQIAGAVGLVIRDGRIVYDRATGWADKEAGRRMTTHAIFRIASLSKGITTTALLVLVEEGRIGFDDPVSRYIPQFAHTTVAAHSDTGRVSTPVPAHSDTGRVIVPAKRAITIRDLLTHTSGISYGTDSIVAPLYRAKGLGPAAGFGWYTADKNEPICTTMERVATLPFVSQPGEAWVYGYNTDILGCVIERVSGVPLDEFIRARITQPLGMKDTYFYLPPAKRQLLATVYTSDSTGHVQRAPAGQRGQGDYVDGPRRSFAGGSGLLSTARDYSRFLQMLANGGELNGVRILAPKTIDLMTTNQVGTLFVRTAGQGFGFGLGTTDRLGADGLASVGTWGWRGAYGNLYRVDSREHLVIVFMIQQVPNNFEVASKFLNLVYQALVEPRK
jgi:CubicO group peptidase (beta-lactamase class C family)